MTLDRYLLFILASAALIATPGPNVALIVGTSIRYGLRTGLTTMMGVNLGLVLQLVAVVIGLASVIGVFAEWFDVFRYAGAAYLIVLAISHLLKTSGDETGRAAAGQVSGLSGRRAFANGFLVALSNPKTLLFHAAFLPQFLSGAGNQVVEIWFLAATFAIIAAVGDGLFGWAAARTGSALSARYARISDKLSAGILLGGAVVLLSMRR